MNNMDYLKNHINSQITPDGTGDVTHGGNWPSSANWAVQVTIDDQKVITKYFVSKEDMDEWGIKEIIEEYPNNKIFVFLIYEWDWGPEFREARTHLNIRGD